MKRCPICGSEMLQVDTHVVELSYHIVGEKRGSTVVNYEKPSPENLIKSKRVCCNCKHTERV